MGDEGPDFTWNRKLIPVNAREDRALLVDWIVENVPCFDGKMPQEWTKAVKQKMQAAHVPEDVIGDVFSLARASGYDFHTPLFTLAILQRNPQPKQAGFSLHPGDRPDGGRWDPIMLEEKAAELEQRYLGAQLNDNAEGMAGALEAALALIWSIIKGHGQARQMRANVKLREWEEFNTAVDEALARASGLRTHLRTLTPEDLTGLRDMPSPDRIRYLRTRIVPRGAPAARRRSRRK